MRVYYEMKYTDFGYNSEEDTTPLKDEEGVYVSKQAIIDEFAKKLDAAEKLMKRYDHLIVTIQVSPQPQS